MLGVGGMGVVVAAHHLANALIGVVHHHREVVCRQVVTAPEYEVVDHCRALAAQQVAERCAPAGAVEAPGDRPPAALALGALPPRQSLTGAGVDAGRGVGVRR